MMISRTICFNQKIFKTPITTMMGSFQLHDRQGQYLAPPVPSLSTAELIEQALALVDAMIQATSSHTRESLLFILEEKLETLASLLAKEETPCWDLGPL